MFWIYIILYISFSYLKEQVRYSRDIVKKICDCLKSGTGRVDTCATVGICYNTFLSWLSDPRKVQFLKRIKKAEEQNTHRIKAKALSCIEMAMSDQWQAAAWFLERKFREEYSKDSQQDDSNLQKQENVSILITRDKDE